MKKICSLLLCLLGLHSLSAAAQTTATASPTPPTDEKLNIANITSGQYSAQYLRSLHPMKDGRSYSQLSPDGKRIVRSSFQTGKEIGTIFDLARAQGSSLSGTPLDHIEGYIMSPDEQKILLQTQSQAIYRHTFTAEYYVYDLRSQRYTPLSKGGAQLSPLFSPDGRYVAFARENNLFLVDLSKNGRETQITTDGRRNEVINGIPDWVNEEEFSTARSFAFSADAQQLCWVRYDETAVPVFRMPMYKGQQPTLAENDTYPGSYDYKYPVAGAQNATVSLHSYDLATATARAIALPLDSDGYIPRIFTTAYADKLAVVTLNRHQSLMQLYMVNPRNGEAQLTLTERHEKYLRESAYTDLRFYGDHFALLSERSGYQHLYWYRLDGQLEATITSGDYEVSQFYGYDAKRGLFYFAAHPDSPLRTEICSADLKGRLTRLTHEGGTHSATFSATMDYFVDQHSSATQAPITTLRTAKGAKLTTLIDNAQLNARLEKLRGVQRFFDFTTSEGVTLNGWMVLPQNFDPAKRYPVVMYQYSGPASQSAKDAWSMGLYPGGVFEHYLAQEGYIAVIVDGRGTGARGSEFEKCTYQRLGELESKDQVEAARYLASLPYVDAARIAIWGWSFGGFNTLMAMSEGHPVFRCGIAIAAPSNWRYYDTVYTERYMRTPQENPNYETVNPIARVEKLHGDLLLIHGTADDNVHYRNCTEMAEALVQAGKPFDMQIYTNRNHNIFGGRTRQHLVERMMRFLNQHLR